MGPLAWAIGGARAGFAGTGAAGAYIWRVASANVIAALPPDTMIKPLRPLRARRAKRALSLAAATAISSSGSVRTFGWDYPRRPQA